MNKTWLKTGLILAAWIWMCTAVSATTIEFWTTETQSDRMKNDTTSDGYISGA